LTAWELHKSGISVEVICDSSAGYWFGRGHITCAVVGADRIAQNGDFANKIGTYAVACLAHLHARPLYVAAPWSTVDLACESGAGIPIESRDSREITEAPDLDPPRAGATTAPPERRPRYVPEGVGVLNPAFDVTPARYVTRLFTERGVFAPAPAGASGAVGFQLREAALPGRPMR